MCPPFVALPLCSLFGKSGEKFTLDPCCKNIKSLTLQLLLRRRSKLEYVAFFPKTVKF